MRRLDSYWDELVAMFVAKKKIIWIISYPRSGNTYMRELVGALFEGIVDEDIPGIHKNPKKAFYSAKTFRIDNEKVCFIKTHSIKFPTYLLPKYLAAKIENYGFIYIYRHPLDVFLSVLNYFYYKGLRDGFINKNVKSVDELKQSGELDLYLDKYIESLSIGSKVFNKMNGGTWLEHVCAWTEAHRQGKMRLSMIVRYEDMINNPNSTFAPLIKLLGKDMISLKKALEITSKRTKKDGAFFWKQKVGNFESYLDNIKVGKFMEKYKDALEPLGY